MNDTVHLPPFPRFNITEDENFFENSPASLSSPLPPPNSPQWPTSHCVIEGTHESRTCSVLFSINKEEKPKRRERPERPQERRRERERPEEREKSINKPRRRKPKPKKPKPNREQTATENEKKPKEKGGRRIFRHCWKQQQRRPEPLSTSHASVAPPASHRLQPRQVRPLPCMFFPLLV